MLIAVILAASLSIVLRCSLLVLEYTQYHRSGYYTATQTPFWKNKCMDEYTIGCAKCKGFSREKSGGCNLCAAAGIWWELF